ILPNRNEKDLDDLPEEVRQSMKFILVDQVDQVFEAALSRPGRTAGNGQPGTRRSSRQPKIAKA
ncbi:MAG TPA: S16 family serine protease, partial [Anaerolineae bacterium]